MANARRPQAPPIPPGTPRRSDEILSIQYLRAFAALAVVVFHIAENQHLYFKVGAAGVDVFFVISGFIMWITTSQRTITPAAFMRRRLVRIAPLYWVSTLVLAALQMIGPYFLPAPVTAPWLIKSLLFIPTYRNGGLWPVLQQGWTLYFEMFFYLVFAAALLLPPSRRIWALLAALSAFTVAGFIVDGPFGDFFSPLFLEFGAGSLVGWLWTTGRLPRAGVGAVMLSAGLCGFAIVHVLRLNFDRSLQWGVPALLMVAGAVSIERRRPIFHSKLGELLGAASYSIYLWQGMVFVATEVVLLHLGLANLPTVIVCSAVAVVAPVILHLILEKPMTAWIYGLVIRRRSP